MSVNSRETDRREFCDCSDQKVPWTFPINRGPLNVEDFRGKLELSKRSVAKEINILSELPVRFFALPINILHNVAEVFGPKILEPLLKLISPSHLQHSLFDENRGLYPERHSNSIRGP